MSVYLQKGHVNSAAILNIEHSYSCFSLSRHFSCQILLAIAFVTENGYST
jgi:hypothetical protein